MRQCASSNRPWSSPTKGPRPGSRGWVRYFLGYAARTRGDIVGARAWKHTARERFSDPVHHVWPHYERGWIDMTEGRVGAAREHFRHGVALIDGQPGDEMMDVHVRGGLALAEADSGNAAAALVHARNAIETARRLDLPGLLVMTLIRSAQTAAVAGTQGGPDLVEALHSLRDHASRRRVADAQARLAAALGAELPAEYDAAGRSTSVPGLLQAALAGQKVSRGNR